ncbi:MAG: AAA family ATPase [Planctomycetota bacterium]|nr:AAA family ATPase [Planctomycetota bacterium]
MITSITIENFKSLQKVELSLGALNLFVGTNASGKSNLFDALRVLQGIGYGFTVDEIFNGKPKSAGAEVWEAIRGGGGKAVFSGLGQTTVETSVNFKVGLLVNELPLTYSVKLAPVQSRVVFESLTGPEGEVFRLDGTHESEPLVTHFSRRGAQEQPEILELDRSRTLLQQLASHLNFVPREHVTAIRACVHGLQNFQRIDPSPTILRDYSSARTAKRMGERGENFAALVKTICQDQKLKSAYLAWLRQLTPAEVDDVTVLEGAVGEPLFAISEGGVSRPAPVLSDGTLRFAAITAAFFQPDMPDVMTIEEIENGIHPSRLRLLVELLRSQAAKDHRQIMATTHSPIVLAWLHENEYKHTFFCRRDESTGASRVCPLDEVTDFVELVRKRPIGDLFSEGWLEGAL